MNESPPAATGSATPGATTVKIVYVLYLVGIMIGITSLIGVIVAYINRSDSPEWLQTHYRFQIRTFWIGLGYFILGWILTGIAIGWLVLLFWLAWMIIRCAKGIKYLDRYEPYPNPTTWFFD